MNLWIPTIGDAFVLEADWHFKLFSEHRNSAMAEALGQPFSGNRYRIDESQPRDVVLPANTELVTDRIYIRQGAGDFDSVTFVIKACPNSKLVGERFWAKLPEVNQIQCVPTTADNPVGPFAKAKYQAELLAQTNPDSAREAQEKRDARERAKDELVLVRERIQSWIRSALDGNGNFEAVRRIGLDLQEAVWRRHHYQITGIHQLYYEETWKCVSTRRVGESVVRRFRVSHYEVTVPDGLQVTTNPDGTMTIKLWPGSV